MKFSTRFVCLAALAALLLPMAAMAGEGRTPIWEPTIITDPGRYVVTRNISSGGPVISIAADGVDIDLNGFVLEAPGAPAVIESSGHSQISIHDGTVRSAVDNIFIEFGKNVVIEDVHNNFAAGTAILLSGVTDFALRRNQISDAFGAGISVDPFGVAPFTTGVMSDNLIERAGIGIGVESGSSVTLERNRIYATSTGHGIRVGGSSAVLLTENTVRETAAHGIWLEGSTGCKLHNNLVSLAGFIGIEIGFTTYTLVLDNVVSGSADSGIFVSGEGNHIERNVMSKNGAAGFGFGLHLVGGSPASPNVYRGNTATGNVGPAAACPFPVSLDFCDATGGANMSALSAIGGDNMMPFPL
jgi:parallel beta-helix repeat protein